MIEDYVNAEEEDEKDDLISAVQFLHILEESIRTFMTFLRADKRSHYQMFREMVRRRASAADQSIVITLKKVNQSVRERSSSIPNQTSFFTEASVDLIQIT